MDIQINNSAVWRRRAHELSDQIRGVEKEINALVTKRSALILDAGSGVAGAAEELANLQRPNLEGTLADLKAARDEANRRLAEAEVIEAAATKVTLTTEAHQLMAARIAAAKRFDEACFTLQKTYDDYQGYGAELRRNPEMGITSQSGMSALESAFGSDKIFMALPPVIRSLFFRDSPMTTLPQRRLAASEASTWGGQLGLSHLEMEG
jgi:hypothetical protein